MPNSVAEFSIFMVVGKKNGPEPSGSGVDGPVSLLGWKEVEQGGRSP